MLEQTRHLIRIAVPVVEVSHSVYKRDDCPDSISVAELAKSRVAYFRRTRPVEALLPSSALVESNNNWDALRRMQFGQAATPTIR